MKQLILGGVRSGKSALAERLAKESACTVTYIATAMIGDGEMAQRVRAHQVRRPPEWSLIEEPVKLASVLVGVLDKGERQCVLVDCLTLWMTNLLLLGDEVRFSEERSALLELLPVLSGNIILVSNETGMGIVPMGELSRRFGDEMGWLHQELAQKCDRVVFMVAGLPQVLKG